MGELEQIKLLLETTLSAINTNLTMHQQMITQLQKENQELRQKLEQNQSVSNTVAMPADSLKKEVLSKFRRNKKRLIKNKILETIRLNSMVIPEIKEIIVDSHNYCSKATFYRYISELKKQDYIIEQGELIHISPMAHAR